MTAGSYTNLREKLEENTEWPLVYMYKFIVPNRDGKIDRIKSHLPQNGKLSYKHTSNLKFVSITCVASMKSADEIIEISEKVSEIEGVISL